MMVCDQPLVTPETIAKLIAVYRITSCPIVASRYGDALGVPALFNRQHFGELASLDNACGAKQIIQKHAANAHAVEFPDGEIDVDTPEDLARINSLIRIDCQ
jgi:molybdenum cofactor cytidylyltransferase